VVISRDMARLDYFMVRSLETIYILDSPFIEATRAQHLQHLQHRPSGPKGAPPSQHEMTQGLKS
jgi:hypothetical protein